MLRSATFAVAALLALSACASNSGPSRSYEVAIRAEDSSEEYAYVAEEALDIRVGDEVTFNMRNAGTLPHDLQVVDPEGNAIGVAPAVASGDSLSLTVLFEEPGFYRLNCLVDNHLTEHGMQEFIEVTEPDS